ncbi:tripartite tricarboxylate transporter substrate binding protein [Achromobacter sp. GG226]|uniref:Bug family tripartite tricarboxylate transporter substrate binding protein n=1 Tax=Verticiella alkaliphila TaxID=2779529 RepID=UPI001C0C3008|nr:tripartite tricarboxylate transporter substrate binding protein [Verticiella sp. GG226]MBU4610834.1 tripartite tricarboxylate transporter substrate binding protein [Verticiella sp. GG226]
MHFLPRLTAAATLAACLAAPALAQAFPNDKPVRIVVPFVPGGPVDNMARILSEKLGTAFGSPVVVDNRPGAGGNIGSDHVAKSAADGHTLLFASGSILTMNEAIYPSLTFSPAKDFTPISVVGDMPLIVAVNAGTPADTLPAFIDYAKTSPAFFSSPGNGTTGHAAAELLNSAAGVKITHVPYKGGAESAMAVMSGQVTGAIDTPPSLLPHIRAGKIKALAIAGPERLSQLPEVPTTTEAGMPELQVLTWFALVAPDGTPAPVVERLHGEVAKALAEDDVKTRFAAMAIRPAGDSPADSARFIDSEREKWEGIIRQAGIRLE